METKFILLQRTLPSPIILLRRIVLHASVAEYTVKYIAQQQ